MATVVRVGSRTIIALLGQRSDSAISASVREQNQGSRAGHRPQQRMAISRRSAKIAVVHGIGRKATKLGVVLATALLAAAPQSVRGQDHTATTNQAVSDNCARSAFRVVVDVSHTLDVPGAMSARGVPEYTFNLQLAREVKQALVDSGFEQTVLLITGTAPWRGLFERAARANAMHADLFISIHHDSVPDNLKQIWEYAGQKK